MYTSIGENPVFSYSGPGKTIPGGGRCLQGNLLYSPPASMTSRLASVTFKMASKVWFGNTVPIFWMWRFKGFYCHKKLDLSTFFGMKCPVV